MVDLGCIGSAPLPQWDVPKFYSIRIWSHCKIEHRINNVINTILCIFSYVC